MTVFMGFFWAFLDTGYCITMITAAFVIVCFKLTFNLFRRR